MGLSPWNVVLGNQSMVFQQCKIKEAHTKHIYGGSRLANELKLGKCYGEALKGHNDI